MTLKVLNLDKFAHDLVYKYRNKDRETVNQVHKMRATVPYGLERFWGEHLRLEGEKSEYWRATWNKLVEIMQQADITVPDTPEGLWDSAIFPLEYRKVTLVILTQLCDCMVWWTQRYKPTRGDSRNGDE